MHYVGGQLLPSPPKNKLSLVRVGTAGCEETQSYGLVGFLLGSFATGIASVLPQVGRITPIGYT